MLKQILEFHTLLTFKHKYFQKWAKIFNFFSNKTHNCLKGLLSAKKFQNGQRMATLGHINPDTESHINHSVCEVWLMDNWAKICWYHENSNNCKTHLLRRTLLCDSLQWDMQKIVFTVKCIYFLYTVNMVKPSLKSNHCKALFESFD